MKKKGFDKHIYSPHVISLLCKLFDIRMSNKNIRNFFAELTDPVSPLFMDTYLVDIFDNSDASNKQERVRDVLNFISVNGSKRYLDHVIAKALIAFDDWYLKTHDVGKKLIKILNEENFPWELLSSKDEIVEGFNIPEKLSLIKSKLQAKNYKISLHHLNETLNSISSGNYSAANSQIRTFFEAFYIDLMHDIKQSTCSGGGCRKEFADTLCSNEENEALRKFAELLHVKGSHPGKGEKHEAEFRLISAIAWVIYSMELSK